MKTGFIPVFCFTYQEIYKNMFEISKCLKRKQKNKNQTKYNKKD
ncbi:hypothetical protein SIN_1863 [Streptococcus infantis SK1302]|uniref:Uncharacterized protein n=1 Tax=Streptococcus infantis SK1302 TaxID=871237 RepID=A0ABP2J1B3_9STRE|nr:hypothetical protein SIN_1863 [Streptococcus infantis SK1302]